MNFYNVSAPTVLAMIIFEFVHSLVFSLRGWVGRNQSPVM